ncbi:hypothetical protein P9250_32480 [Caballeronia sp. LP006]|uniref:hypothetical protein n=1 Tax=Caballeronia sp. LP006 TaxID=3038552 RepID=UPI002864F2B5|nr:hypothetical protein [Caballeronia sp. LP006]MDR5832566.1 hypothetical protein [Caballeronia sp. LP006]
MGDSGDQGDFSWAGWRRRSRGRRDPREPHDPIDPSDSNDRWPAEMPSVEVARVVLKVDASITLKRTAAAAWLTAQGDAVPLLPVKPTRMELAVVIALAETYGTPLYKDARFVPVIDFIADYGAVVFVQRVMYGARPASDNSADFDVTAYAAENARLAEAVRDARVAFEFLCATWPEVFLAQTHAVLAGLGIRVRPPEADLVPPLSDIEDQRHDVDENDRDKDGHNHRDHHDGDDEGNDSDGKEGGHA